VKGIAIFDGEQGRRVLKQMGMMPAAKKTDKGMKVKPGKMIPEPQVLTASQILGSYAQEKAEVRAATREQSVHAIQSLAKANLRCS